MIAGVFPAWSIATRSTSCKAATFSALSGGRKHRPARAFVHGMVSHDNDGQEYPHGVWRPPDGGYGRDESSQTRHGIGRSAVHAAEARSSFVASDSGEWIFSLVAIPTP
jgi:hypothetical protein